MKRYPVAFCPNCRRTILYSADPKDKSRVCAVRASEEYRGKTILCAKCKTMLALRERADGKTVRVPIVGTVIS
ncbi:MAG: hypothetical protein IKS34_00540 [Clostridia bacterium]|nr:hypothetical protein [Clostridia bacterium]MBR4466765.1 hypothetical protein [Clostridia bacterium]